MRDRTACSGEPGNDIVFGGDGNEGTTGGDFVEGNEGNDVLFGGTGNDSLYGGADNDTLSGDAGNDRLHGGIGNDFFAGGVGADLLYGEDGLDRFTYAVGDVTTAAGTEFVFGGGVVGTTPTDLDTIDLTAFGAQYGWRSIVIDRGSLDRTDAAFENGTIAFLMARWPTHRHHRLQ